MNARSSEAISGLGVHSDRFVCWSWQTRHGKPTKPPIAPSGAYADSTDPASWCSLDEALDAAEQPGFDGVGFVLDAARDGIVGVDLDGCRDPASGKLEPWATRIVNGLRSYAEVSPSGMGVKILVKADPVPVFATNKIVIAKANGTGKDQAVEVYTTGRYFCLTGQILPGVPDEIVENTEAVEKLAHRLGEQAKAVPDKAGKRTKAPPSRGELPQAFHYLLVDDDKLRHAWETGAKLGNGKDISASGLDMSLAFYLRPHLDDEDIADVLRFYPHGQIGGGKLRGKAAERRIENILAELPARHSDGDDQRERIDLNPAKINHVTRRCAELVDDTVYMRGQHCSALVRAGDVDPDAILGGVQHDRSSLIMVPVTAGMVQYKLDERAAFFKRDVRSKSDVQVSCPKNVAQRLIDAATEMPLLQCSGIVTTPLFLNGEIIATPGYHEPTGKIISFPGTLPPIPDAPAKAEALAALDVLLRPFRGYLREDDPRLRSGLAAAQLTAVARASLPTAPAIVLDANTPGAGKGKAGRALAVTAAGTLPAMVTEGHAEEETEKRIASAILSGASVLLLDNMQRTLASSTLESALTEGIATIRLFGKLGDDMHVPFPAMVIVTTNNAPLRADLLRRILPIRILVDTDSPEKREFRFDPYLEAKRDRLKILAAGFTILRAWWNNRSKTRTLGSFEQWAELVAGAVEWLTGTNPITLIEDRKAEDPGRAEERQVITALRHLFREAEWTAKEAVGQPARRNYDDNSETPATGLDPELWRSVLQFKGERPNPVEVGKWLSRQKDKVFGDLRLTCKLDRDKKAHWTVSQSPGAESAGVTGVTGVSRCQSLPAARDVKEHKPDVMTNEQEQVSTTPADTRDTRTSPTGTTANCSGCRRVHSLNDAGLCEGCAAGERMFAEVDPPAAPKSRSLREPLF